MIGLNLLFRLGRKFLAAPLEDSGLMPESYYQSQALAALEEDDFNECLRYLKLAHLNSWEKPRLVEQLLILRLRLLQKHHQHHCQAIKKMVEGVTAIPPSLAIRYQEVLAQEELALKLLNRHEQDALRLSASDCH